MKLLSKSEAARLLGVSVYTVDRMLRDGRLHTVTPFAGARALITLQSVQSVTATPSAAPSRPTVAEINRRWRLARTEL